MTFLKKSQSAKRQRALKSIIQRQEGLQNRVKREMQQATSVEEGSRVVGLRGCDIPLSFRYMDKEIQCGLDSTFEIRCMKCPKLYNILSSSKDDKSESGDSSRKLYAMNAKAAVGSISAGVSPLQHNEMSAMNLPKVHPKKLEIAEECLAECEVAVVKDTESCLEDISGKMTNLTFAKRDAQPTYKWKQKLMQRMSETNYK